VANTLNSLLDRVTKKDEALAAELRAQINVLARRREFGLNFEKHQPENLELPTRRIRQGDRVRFLAPRGSSASVRRDTWVVVAIDDGPGVASLVAEHGDETTSRAIADLVLVADFRDPVYPGLVSSDRVERGGSKPFHAVINSENYHALESMLFWAQGKVDAIYIDPPYNTRDKDWKYNNDYVDSDDDYKHSKWLSFMERRLKLARKLLSPEKSVLIVTIDDNEVHRLGLLLEQEFQGRDIQMVTSVVNPRGKYRRGSFSRSDEYIFFVLIGAASVAGEPDLDYSEGALVPWRTFRRSDIDSARGTAKGGTNQFFPVYVNTTTSKIELIGKPIAPNVDRFSVKKRKGCVAVFPVRDDGTEMNWGLTPDSARSLLDKGYLRVGKACPDKPQLYEISYLTSGRIEDVEEGRAVVEGYDASGAVIARYATHKIKMPVSTWMRESHNAEVHGTELLKELLGEKSFPYPKSLYAVEDCLRYFIGDNTEALVLDFFAGSGTTTHAVMRLNRQDGGARRSIIITNNEVSAKEAARLRADGYRPGDPEWEALGICNTITKPRVRAALTGERGDHSKLEGEYRFTDPFPMSEGFAENVEFFDLTYEDPRLVGLDLAFEAVAPLLWLRAGATGERITSSTDSYAAVDTYAVLFNMDSAAAFVKDVVGRPSIRVVFIVTDDEKQFQMVASDLPSDVEAVRLYEAYLRTFEVNTGKD